jgi:glycosyltransferase domain-containing protein
MTPYSIVIPTFNRPHCLKRLLDYCDECKIINQIIVVDSSSKENKSLNKEILDSHKNLRINYLDSYPETVNPFVKYRDALNYVDAKYCFFCADDDFFFPKGIEQLINFLDNNSDYSTAYGYHFNFWIDKNEEFKYRIIRGESIENQHPEERLYRHLSKYNHATFYDVHKTESLKLALTLTLKYTNDYRFGELFPSMLDLIYGKMKYLNILSGAREISFLSGGKTTKTMHDFIRENKYEEKYKKFKEGLILSLTKDKSETECLIDKAMVEYLGKSKKHNFMNIINWLFQHLGVPEKHYEKFRSFIKTKANKFDFIKQEADVGNIPSQDFAEFEAIKKQAIKYV